MYEPFIVSTGRIVGPEAFRQHYRIVRDTLFHRDSFRWYEVSIVHLVCFLKTITLPCYHFCPLSHWGKVALFDLFFLAGTDSLLNVAFFVLAILAIYISYHSYFNASSLYGHKWVMHFLQDHTKSNDRTCNARQLWRTGTNPPQRLWHGIRWMRFLTERWFIDWCIISLQITFVIIISFLVTLQLLLLVHVNSLDLDLKHKLQLWALAEVNAVLLNITVLVSVQAMFITMLSFVVITMALFRLLDRTNQLLSRNRANFLQHCYYRYTINHTKLVLEVIRSNHLISTIYLVFVVSNVPLNAFMLTTLLMGKISPQIIIFTAFLVQAQLTLGSISHKLLSMYEKKIHAKSKYLFKISIQQRDQFRSSLRSQLHLDHYVAKFHTKHTYGITYGSLGVVNNQSLGKQIFYYFRMFIFTYHIWSK